MNNRWVCSSHSVRGFISSPTHTGCPPCPRSICPDINLFKNLAADGGTINLPLVRMIMPFVSSRSPKHEFGRLIS